jgi:hypothetical protein
MVPTMAECLPSKHEFKPQYRQKKKKKKKVHTSNPSTQETKAGGSQVQGQPGIHNETLPLKKKKKQINQIWK